MNYKKIIAVVIPILFTAQACNLLFGNTGLSGPMGVFFSEDSGLTWESMNANNEELQMEEASVSEIYQEPGNPENLLLSTLNRGLIASDDGGERWFRLLPNAVITDAFINPNNPREIYAAGQNDNGLPSIWVSPDRGSVWQTIYSVPSSRASIRSFALDPIISTTFYAAVTNGTVIRSVDSGVTWKVLDNLPSPIKEIAVSASSDRKIYALTEAGLYSSNDGANWVKNQIDPRPQTYNELVLDPINNSVLYLGTSDGLYRSRDSGQTWQRLDLPTAQNSRNVTAIAVNSDNPNQIYAAVLWTIFRSDDSGDSWRTSALPTRRVISEISVDEFSPNLIYAGFQ